MVEAVLYRQLATNALPAQVPTDRVAVMSWSKEFWSTNGGRFPALILFAEYAFTIATSSGSAERAFSVLKRCFGNGQRLALEDYSSLSCMLQVNGRQ